MRKVISLLLALTMMGSSSIAFAATSESIDTLPKAVYDTEKIPDKNFMPYRIDESNKAGLPESYATRTGPYWVANSRWYPLDDTALTASDSFTDSTKSTRYAIDRIMAKTRLYFQGGLDGSQTDDNNHSSHSGAIATCSSNLHWVGNHEVYGAHVFQESGFSSWYPETYDT